MKLSGSNWPMCSLALIEEAHILNVLRHSDTLRQACAVLNIAESTLWRRLTKFKFFRREISARHGDFARTARAVNL